MADASPVSEVRFRAMGSDCRILAVGGTDEHLDFAMAEVARLEALWSRFHATSEIAVLNARDGRPAPASRETVALLCRAVRGQRITGGWFDPFMGREIAALGYDRDFDLLAGGTADERRVPPPPPREAGGGLEPGRQPAEAWLGISRHPLSVRIPAGYDFDPGGIGKGFGADLVSLALIERGAHGVLVDLGGDIRVRGRHPDDGWEVGWDVAPDAERACAELVRLTHGAIATSAPKRRQWVGTDGRRQGHLIHPAMGLPVGGDIASVTIRAQSGWLAEALCTALLVGGPRIGRSFIEQQGARGFVVMSDGAVTDV